MVTRRSVMMAGLLGAAGAPMRLKASPVETSGKASAMFASDELDFIRGLIAEMTLEEKLGQLTMVSANLAETGPVSTPWTLEGVRQGRIGSIFNLWGSERVREVQRL